jgi:hypothetical protein
MTARASPASIVAVAAPAIIIATVISTAVVIATGAANLAVAVALIPANVTTVCANLALAVAQFPRLIARDLARTDAALNALTVAAVVHPLTLITTLRKCLAGNSHQQGDNTQKKNFFHFSTLSFNSI